MSPIIFYHMSLTNPQTPINRSLPKAFLHTKIFWKTSWKTPTHQGNHATNSIKEDSEIQKLYCNLALKPPRTSRTSTSNMKNIQSTIIQTTFLDLKVFWNQGQKPSETSRNHKLAKLYEFKP